MSCNYKTNIKDIQSKYTFKIFCAGDTSQIEQEIGNLSDLTTTAKNNLVSAINEVDGELSAQDETISTLETNLEETQAELDYYKTIYNVLPKVNGNGESITLDNTGESILKLDPRGQCKQDSTTGKNKISLPTSYNNNGITITPNNNGTFTINGTRTSGSGYIVTGLAQNTTLQAGDYTFYVETSKLKSDNSLNIRVRDTDNNAAFDITLENVYRNVVNKTLSATTTIGSIASWINVNDSINNANVKMMIVSGTYTLETIGEWEKFTGGKPSPSPDYPQQIHEGSGDNEINVYGKNLFDVSSFESQLVSGKILNDSGVETSDSSSTYSTYMIYLKANTTYHLKGYWQRIYYYDENKVFKSRSAAQTDLRNFNYTPTENEYLQFQIKNEIWSANKGQEMINIGDTATPYEPYNGDTYELDLGVENKFNKDDTFRLGYIDSSGNFNSDSTTALYEEIPVQPNTTYTISFKEQMRTFNSVYYDNSKDFLSRGTPLGNITKATFTTPNNCKYLSLQMSYLAGTTMTQDIIDSLDIQLEVGSKASSFSPFGQTPIKMRGIGTYEDYFTKNTGKNKLAPTSNEINETINGVKREGKNGVYAISGTASASGGGNVKYALTNSYTIQNGDYLHLCNTSTTYNASFILFDDNDTQINDYSINAVNRIIDLSTYAGKVIKSIGLYNNSSFNANITLSPMILNNVSSTTGFEPFGKDMWCKYNAIGSIILDGSETGWALAGSNNYYYLNNDIFPLSTGTGGQIYPAYSNYYISDKYNNIYGGTVDYGFAFSYNSHRIVIRNKDITSTNDFTTWLTTHNTQVDFGLTIPYLELITNNTLKSQLDVIEKALSKDGQTNISQTNNDIPFKIYASALMKISGE